MDSGVIHPGFQGLAQKTDGAVCLVNGTERIGSATPGDMGARIGGILGTGDAGPDFCGDIGVRYCGKIFCQRALMNQVLHFPC